MVSFSVPKRQNAVNPRTLKQVSVRLRGVLYAHATAQIRHSQPALARWCLSSSYEATCRVLFPYSSCHVKINAKTIARPACTPSSNQLQHWQRKKHQNVANAAESSNASIGLATNIVVRRLFLVCEHAWFSLVVTSTHILKLRWTAH